MTCPYCYGDTQIVPSLLEDHLRFFHHCKEAEIKEIMGTGEIVLDNVTTDRLQCSP